MAEEKEFKKEKEVISGTFTASDLANLIGTMAQSNREALKEFARELATGIAHPEPTDKEKELMLQNSFRLAY